MEYQVGEKIGGYEVIEVLGNSRIGACYKVRNVIGDRFEILRILPKDGQVDREQIDRFVREIKVHARLSHSHIVAFYNALEVDGELVMTTESVDGISLEQRLGMGPVPVNEAIHYACQALDALGYAHEHAVVHREISPVNILITMDGNVKLSGFGLAKSAADAQLTQTGTVMGWLEYMSPEQVQALPELGPATDIYSLGAVLYEMLTGQPPFVCESQFDLMLAHVKTLPKSPRMVRPAISEPLSAIVLTALEKDPAKRFPSAQKFRQALELSLADPGPELHDEPALETPLAPEQAPEQWTLKRLAIAGTVMFFVLLIFFFAVLRSGG
jgi:serine/threonine protein kinase